MSPLLMGALLWSGVPPVATRKEAVVDTIHGVKVADPYRWLEDGDAPEVSAWTDAQNAFLRKTLDAVPGRKAIEDRLWQLHEIGALGVPVAKARGTGASAQSSVRYFTTRRTGKQNQAVLYVRDGAAGTDRALIDVNALAADGTSALDWWFPSEDGRLCAYGVSKNGDEESVLRVRVVDGGMDLKDEITRVRHASLAWLPDGTGFYYTRYPAAGSVPAGDDKYHRTVFFHRLGSDPEQDPLIYQDARDKTYSPSVALSPDGRYLVLEVWKGWDETELYLVDRSRKGAPSLQPMVTGRKAIYNVADILDDRLYVASNEGAPRYRVFQVDLKKPARDSWKEIIKEGPDALDLEGGGVVFLGGSSGAKPGRKTGGGARAKSAGKLAALYLKDASSRVRIFDVTGKFEREIPLPALGTAARLSARHEDTELFFAYSSYLTPTTIFRLDVGSDESPQVWQKLVAPIDAAAFEVSQVRYPSKDGTSVPMFLVHRRGLVRDGRNPTLLYGYGGFNISITPAFASQMAPFIEAGGVYAVANLRGGAEYGETWHQAGMLGRKQNVFDDFIAAAEYLIAEKITSRDRLSCSGRSNGGLLAGAVLTQRPDLFRAVISGVPLLDMIRYHKFRIAQLWIPEYGSSDDVKQFKWLYAYSPYHRVKDGVAYPATLIFTAESDSRVDPMHARKMAARLQAATSGLGPILLRLEKHAGHGAGKPLGKIIAQYTDELAFLFGQLGMKLPGAAAKATP